MRKQCNYCGDYFFTTITGRLFCSIKCIRLHAENPMTRHSPKLKRKDGSDSKKCALCPTLVPLLLLRKVKWDKKSHLVCVECFLALGDKVEEDMFIRSEDVFPSPIGLDAVL